MKELEVDGHSLVNPRAILDSRACTSAFCRIYSPASTVHYPTITLDNLSLALNNRIVRESAGRVTGLAFPMIMSPKFAPRTTEKHIGTIQ